ncbi:cysteine proteinase [Hortaea werneckii]|nr:cysteine proteinase [Hortaea werneckii]
MSFFGKLKGSSSATQPATTGPVKKDPNAPVPTPLEKHLADATGSIRPDGSDKFFGFENYGSTCYCNSIIQCLYFSAPFRNNVLNFPSKGFLEQMEEENKKHTDADGNPVANGAPLSPKNTSSTPYPNMSSPARKSMQPTSPGGGNQVKQEENKDSPEYRKKLALAAGPVLDMTGDNSTQYGMDESLFTSLKDIFEAIINNQSRIGVVSPHKFLEILRRENEMFRSAMHQDAHEFLNLLLNQVVDNVELFAKQHPQLLQQAQANGGAPEEMQGQSLSPATAAAIASRQSTSAGLATHWVHDLFEGLLTSETRCLTCENTSQRDEAFLDLSVDLAAHTSVTSCLRKFSEEEMLCERNKFHCDNCGGLQEAEKRMKIKRLPRILALHLKRFKYTEDLQRLQKLFHKVVYPFHLRLFNTTEDAEDPDRLYELYAVVVHIGGGPYHGHYVSIIKTQDRGWLLFDDELVEPVDKDYVLNFFGGEPVPGVQDAKQLACAYVLFYQETTLEAVLKEQEAEGTQQAASRMTEAQTAKDGATSPTKPTNLEHAQTVTTPPAEYMASMDPLAHARTAPTEMSPHRPPFEHHATSPGSPIATSKTKKELKAEEKERKAQQKAQQKLDEQKRKEESAKRIERWKKQDEEYKQVLEMSKQSALDEAKRRGDDGAGPTTAGGGGGGEKSSGSFSRFTRPGSMSLRGKPKFFGKDKATAAAAADGSATSTTTTLPSSPFLPTVPQGQAASDATDFASVGAPPPPTPGGGATTDPAANPLAKVPSANGGGGGEEQKKLRNRFSLGRKKSGMM